MTPPWSEAELPGILASLGRAGRLAFIPTPGNAGDSFIAAATVHLLRGARLEFDYLAGELPTGPSLRGRTVLIGGGGNLIPQYSQTRDALLRTHEAASNLIVLPQSVSRNVDLLERLGNNVLLMAREEPSYCHALAHARNAKVALAHDITLYVEIDAFLSDLRSRATPARVMRDIVGELLSARHVLRGRLMGLKMRRALRARQRTSGNAHRVLRCFREDGERTKRPLPADNLDLSGIFGWGHSSVRAVEAATLAFLETINCFEEIESNRLHVAIAAAHLGKRVRLFANSYYKNHAVYEHSLAPRFPRVSWMGE